MQQLTDFSLRAFSSGVRFFLAICKTSNVVLLFYTTLEVYTKLRIVSREQWPYLIRYLEDGRLELSNNRAERSIKPFVMGRKNWLFSNTPAGAQSSAVIYSLIETAKENDLDPYRYLVWLLHNAPEQSQKDEDWPEFFLPVNAPKECRS